MFRCAIVIIDTKYRAILKTILLFHGAKNNFLQPPKPRACKKPKLSHLDAATVQLNLTNIVNELYVIRANNGGKLPYGATASLLREKLPTLSWLTKDQVNYHMKQLDKESNATVTVNVTSPTGGDTNFTSLLYIIELDDQLCKMRVPINGQQGLRLVNSLIFDTTTLENLIEWQKTSCAAYRINKNKDLTKSYWKGFMSRNGHRLTAKKGVKYDSKRADWCTYRTFKEMYDDLYEQMVETGIAVKLDQAVLRNKEGQIVDNTDEAFGMETRYDLIHPEKLIFVKSCSFRVPLLPSVAPPSSCIDF
jgi:hypothetical protein